MRGRNDFLASSDMEDIIAVVDGNTRFSELCLKGSPKVRAYLKTALSTYLDNDDFVACVEAHIADRIASSARATILVSKIKQTIAAFS